MNYAFIFDMDGVVIDSNPYHKIAWERFLVRKNRPFTDEIFDNFISGRTGVTNIRTLLGKDLPDEKVTAYVNEIDGEFQEILRQAEGVGPTPGLPGFLKTIQASGYKIALATSAPPKNVDLALEKTKLRIYFNVILDKNDVTNGKPDPEIYLNTLKRLDAKKEECIVFEDSRAGIESALRAGIKVIGIATGLCQEELLEAGVTLAINDFQDLQLKEVINLIENNYF